MNDAHLSAALRARIFDAFPVAQPSFLHLLGLLDIEATDAVASAAVTVGGRSRLQINPRFVEQRCATDHDLVMLVLHELHHVVLGHTRLFRRVTRAQNWAFDCVINAQLCRLFPQPQWTRLFRACYRADVLPEALLRPPEGWCTADERWLPGRAGRLHRALYSEDSVSYLDLYELLQSVVGEHAGLDALLGNHAPVEAEGIAPDVGRELRDIAAGWPLAGPRGGAGSGGEWREETVGRAEAGRQAVAQIRRALLAVAEAGEFGARGAPAWQPAPALLPYAPRSARSGFLRAALGSPALLHEAELARRLPQAQQRTHVYLDVSGSMNRELPLIYAALRPLAALLHPRVHLFSTGVADIDLAELARGVRIGSGGTDIGVVTEHLLRHRVGRAVILTDGWVGDVLPEHASTLARRRCRLAAVVSGGGDHAFARPLSCRVWRLPRLDGAA